MSSRKYWYEKFKREGERKKSIECQIRSFDKFVTS